MNILGGLAQQEMVNRYNKDIAEANQSYQVHRDQVLHANDLALAKEKHALDLDRDQKGPQMAQVNLEFLKWNDGATARRKDLEQTDLEMAKTVQEYQLEALRFFREGRMDEARLSQIQAETLLTNAQTQTETQKQEAPRIPLKVGDVTYLLPPDQYARISELQASNDIEGLDRELKQLEIDAKRRAASRDQDVVVMDPSGNLLTMNAKDAGEFNIRMSQLDNEDARLRNEAARIDAAALESANVAERADLKRLDLLNKALSGVEPETLQINLGEYTGDRVQEADLGRLQSEAVDQVVTAVDSFSYDKDSFVTKYYKNLLLRALNRYNQLKIAGKWSGVFGDQLEMLAKEHMSRSK